MELGPRYRSDWEQFPIVSDEDLPFHTDDDPRWATSQESEQEFQDRLDEQWEEWFLSLPEGPDQPVL